jgi:hypothetical protein
MFSGKEHCQKLAMCLYWALLFTLVRLHLLFSVTSQEATFPHAHSPMPDWEDENLKLWVTFLAKLKNLVLY